jgi:hypothetical protein
VSDDRKTPQPGAGKWSLQKMPHDRHLFIVTYGRSGSTLLQNLVNSIPGYEIRGENNNALLHYFRAWKAIEGCDTLTQMRAAGEPSDQTHPWFGGEKIRPAALGRSLARNFVAQVLKPSEGVRVTGFKEIRFHSVPEEFEDFLNFIHAFFPGSQFLFNTRDHASVARSGWWVNRKPEVVAEILTRAEALFRAYLEKYPARGYHVHYDDYVGQPDRLRPLFDFLREDHDEAMVRRVMEVKLDHLKKRGAASE